MTQPSQRLVHDPDGLNTGVWPISANRILTPVDSFFTRSHAPVPRIDPETWQLEVGGLVSHPARFTLGELASAFPRRQVAATLVCAGLRRNEFLSLAPMPGELPWGAEPVSTGEWAGVALRDLLHAVEVAPGARYVEFIGLDQVERQGKRFGFGGSIDLAKGFSEEVLLATELNGAALPDAHGFPLRVVVPGWIGARSVKWLGRINLRAEPSPNYFQERAYRIQRETDPSDSRSVAAGLALTEVPVNSVILAPTMDQVVRAGPVEVRGWAMGSAGRPLAGVELSPNDGEDWVAAEFAEKGSAWTWAFWQRALELMPGYHTLAVRAFDCTGAVQPPTVAATWNVKGYSNNAWHRVRIRVEE